MTVNTTQRQLHDDGYTTTVTRRLHEDGYTATVTRRWLPDDGYKAEVTTTVKRRLQDGRRTMPGDVCKSTVTR